MRLLNCRTKTVEEFIGDSFPKYAILSHTWEEEEVVFDDIVLSDIDYTIKKGWWKIAQACDRALRDGLSYLWADTICIDKSSSAELSEAINSMFKWYRNAIICYAYLCDLPDVSLEHSRWFTRGWTLQEMIAPERLRFYDRNWVVQGSKNDLLDRLCNITGVDVTALRGGNLRFFSVARKMSWASKRLTTREEDMAYCLLGIFDISMPLLYGEGAKAFIRLQEAIIKEYDDESLFAWRSTQIGKTSGLLAPSPKAFDSSANLVPCLTPAAMLSMSGPIAVTSRGIRLEVPVEQFEENTNARLVRLNCKHVSYDRESGMRFGIIVTPLARMQGYPSTASMYGRIHPNRLHRFIPNPDLELQTVFLLKENHLQDFDLSSADIFLVRSMPRWPRDRAYRLTQALPTEAWDEKNDIFQLPKKENTDQPFVLVFRRDPGPNDRFYHHFIIAFGRELTAEHVTEGILGGRIWCNAVFRQVEDIDDLDVDREVHALHRQEKTVEVQEKGGGTFLKCHVRPEIICGQPMFCVDLLVKTVA